MFYKRVNGKSRRFLIALPPLLMLSMTLSGCGRTQDGPQRYELSGQVTYRGQPVPVGVVRITPDVTKGHRGPGTVAEIVKGRYVTRNRKGMIGGPTVLEISGYDGVPVDAGGEMNRSGTPLFELHRIEIDLPYEAAQRNFDIPESVVKSPSN